MYGRILIENLTYAALLSLDDGKSKGSGFFFRSDDADYLVTAKHVLYEGDVLRCKTIHVTSQDHKGSINSACVYKIDVDTTKVLHSRQADVALIPVGDVASGQLKDYVFLVQQGTTKPMSIEAHRIRLLEDIRISNDVFLVGFPTSLIFRDSSHFDPSTPLLRKGIVAGIVASDNTFIIDCSSYYGNSGGPILELGEDNQMRLVGVVSRYIPFVVEWRNNRERSITHNEFLNSGYTVCVPMNEVVTLITGIVK